MSVKVTGVIDLPQVNLSDIDGIYETINFLLQNEILSFLTEYEITYSLNEIKFTHKTRSWSYFIIKSNGTLEIDKHFSKTEEDKEALLMAIRQYYPMLRKMSDILQKVKTKKYQTHYDKEKDAILIEIEEV